MTLEEIEAMDKGCISSTVAAAYLGCVPYYITLMARDCPDKLPFPTFRSGNRTKIPPAAILLLRVPRSFSRVSVGKIAFL